MMGMALMARMRDMAARVVEADTATASEAMMAFESARRARTCRYCRVDIQPEDREEYGSCWFCLVLTGGLDAVCEVPEVPARSATQVFYDGWHAV